MLSKLRTLFGLVSLNSGRGDVVDAQLISPKPEHVAVIMDGNGRWANAKGMSRISGHKRGADAVKSLIKGCIQHDIRYLSIFAFSSENWTRPRAEVDALMDLLINALETQTRKLNENGVQLRLLGDLTKFSDHIQTLAAKAQQQTSGNSKLVFNVAINYGGRWDITQACQRLAERVELGELSSAEIDEQTISNELSTSGMPDPDLYIRTSGEFRISNFLLWQAAYSEFYFSDVLWPDFDEAEFTKALMKYTRRDRRFGNAVDGLDSQQSSTSKPVDSKSQASTKHA